LSPLSPPPLLLLSPPPLLLLLLLLLLLRLLLQEWLRRLPSFFAAYERPQPPHVIMFQMLGCSIFASLR
jgi:hypothetical protein